MITSAPGTRGRVRNAPPRVTPPPAPSKVRPPLIPVVLILCLPPKRYAAIAATLCGFSRLGYGVTPDVTLTLRGRYADATWTLR